MNQSTTEVLARIDAALEDTSMDPLGEAFECVITPPRVRIIPLQPKPRKVTVTTRTEYAKKAAGKVMTLTELEQFAAGLRTLGAADSTPVQARIRFGGRISELSATVTGREQAR